MPCSCLSCLLALPFRTPSQSLDSFRKFIECVLLVCLVIVPPIAGAQAHPTPASLGRAGIQGSIADPSLSSKVEAVLQKMTLEEKVGQLVQYSAGQATGPGTGRTDYKDMIAKGQLGAMFNITKAHDANAFQRIAVEQSRLYIPILFGLDVIHGFRTEFPIPLGLASTWDLAIVEKAARIAAQEASATGIRWTFSPMIDIARDARWGRMAEGAGEDPFLGAAIGAAYIRGYQGARLDAPDSIAACAKHYVGYGAAEGGRDYNTTEISESTLRQIYLPPFRAAVNAGSASIMSAFNALNGIPASANAYTLKQILRKEWGFQGIVDSDWTSVAELIPHGIANDGEAAARRAFLAGVDMDMVSSLYHDHLAHLVQTKHVSQSDLDEAVRHVLRVKFALGLFEHPYADETKEEAAMLRPENVEVARAAAERSLVLLKNSAGPAGAPVLPLSKSVGKVALIGPLANDSANMLGCWGAQGRAEDVTTLQTALTAYLGNQNVFSSKGTGISEGSDQEMADAVAAAQKSDLVILALGENAPEMTGEAASRSRLDLPGRQQELLEKVVATGKPVVLILSSGRPLTLPWAFEHVPAVLAAWFPGVQAGPALVRTLFGESNPSGRLVVSWPRSVGQEPLYYNALNTGRPANLPDSDKKYVSRYIDEQNGPQFPFGFGLSYTSIRYGAVEIGGKELKASALNAGLHGAKTSAVTVTAPVTNSGQRASEEVVQLYIRLQGTSVAQPVRALKGFERVALAPGETKNVRFTLPPDAFAIWSDQNKLEVEPARVTIWVSPDSAHGSPAQLEIVP
ncbi:MAG: beta-glucosidase [Acidobacteria bacterium]|nr:MAG: beta-glucosidase [Acidobacteriota bacterium]